MHGRLNPVIRRVIIRELNLDHRRLDRLNRARPPIKIDGDLVSLPAMRSLLLDLPDQNQSLLINVQFRQPGHLVQDVVSVQKIV